MPRAPRGAIQVPRGDEEMRYLKRTRLALAIILALCLFTPTVYAKRKVHVRVFTVPDFDDFVQYDHSEMLPNGFIKVDVCYKFFWFDDEMNYLGYAYQIVTGVTKVGSGNDFSALHGYGVFYSEVDGKPGTITYEIGNNWKAETNTYWAGHLSIRDGTGYFEGLKGQGELNFEIFAFELYLDYDPWA
jgi:hypothetical protein